MKKELWIACAAASLLSACGGGGGGGAGTGALSIGVTDAPVDEADEVVVTFTGVQLLGSDGGVRETFTLTTPLVLDLLDYQGNDSATLILDQQVPAGVYQEVRLLTDMPNASCNQALADPDLPSYISIDGTRYPLIVPSSGSSGFKVRGPLTIAVGGSASYTVDFDLRKSIAERGSTGCYNLKPVLRVVDNAQVGTLSGSVDPALLADSACTSDPVTGEGAAVYVYTGAGVVPDDFDGIAPDQLTTSMLTPVLGEGGAVVDFTYEVGFLSPGNYTVALSCQAGDDLPEQSDDGVLFTGTTTAAVSVGATTDVDFAVVPPPAS